MTTRDPTRQSIGFGLNRAGQAIICHMSNLLHADNISRIGWQVLNTLQSRGEMPESKLPRSAQRQRLSARNAKTVEALLANAWVEQINASLRLADCEQTKPARLRRRIEEFGRRSCAGASDQDYPTVIRVPHTIVGNLRDTPRVLSV